MRQPTFSRLVYEHFASWPGMAEKVKDWLNKEHGPEERACRFACHLSEKFMLDFTLEQPAVEPDERLYDEAELRLINQCLELSCQHVNWQGIAEALFRRFGTHALPERRAWSWEGLRGSVN